MPDREFDSASAPEREDPFRWQQARKWIQLWIRSTQGDPEVRDGLRRAWENREDWPLPVQQYAAEMKLPQIVEWICKAIEEMKKDPDSDKAEE